MNTETKKTLTLAALAGVVVAVLIAQIVIWTLT